MKAPKPSPPSQKQKSLSIHIATDHIGPSKMPLVYGSTPEKVGSIRGTVRFSTNYPCKGKDIVVMYEAKAEAQWSALENKKVVRHQTEEILGYHIWHFPLDHTKAGGSTVAVGVYEKDFEVPLAHPSVSLRGWSASSPSPSPLSSAGSAAAAAHSKINSAAALPPTTATTIGVMVGAKPVGPVAGLLPSSSYGPQARIKYTIRAILQRPFPCITHIEASQEVWVLNSSLPPQFHSATLSDNNNRPRSNAFSRQKKRRSSKDEAPTTTTTATATATANPTSTSAGKDVAIPEPSTSSGSEALKSQPLISLPMPSQVIKSALAMLPSIDLSRSKQLFSMSKSGPGSGSGTDSSPSQPSTSVITTTPATATITPSTTAASATTKITPNHALTAETDTNSEAGSSSPLVSSPPLADYPSPDENEAIADYTGVWEAFDIPYSLSLPSEIVYLGQVVPLTIRFGPHRGYHKENQDKENSPRPSTSSRRFVVKKGVLRLVEHTLLREVTTAQIPPQKAQNKNQTKSLALTTNAHDASQATLEEIFDNDSSRAQSPPPPNFEDQQQQPHRRGFSEQQQQQQVDGTGKGKRMMASVFGKRQEQSSIYQEQGYHGSHSHLPLSGDSSSSSSTLAVQQQRNTRSQHQQQLSLPGDMNHHHHPQQQQQQQQQQGGLRRSVLKPNRHSMDVLTGRPVSMISPYGATSSNPRIVSSIEAKFKTEVMVLSLTPFLQRQEQWYQRQLAKAAGGQSQLSEKNEQQDGSGNIDGEQDEQDEGEDDMYVEEEEVEEDVEEGVWQTTIWIPIPGPSAMATFTETKNIMKTHTLQLILLCGLGGEPAPSPAPVPVVVVQGEEGVIEADAGSAASVPAVSLSAVNKEFRLEMDLHVTGPRAPVEMTLRHL
ncbi:hypothetical protein BGX33_005983 [Mortierella sp. NVP41]|nr:hypothetical protein BGX33_005983 [Mortierella sp. NVP41]